MQRVLIIDAHASFRLIYTMHFFKLGYSPIPVANYDTALEQLAGSPDAMLVFLNVPSVPDDALAFVHTIHERFPQIVVLACTEFRSDLAHINARLPDTMHRCFYAPPSADALRTHLIEAGISSRQSQ